MATKEDKIVRGADLATVGALVRAKFAEKQDTLVSGTNLKTINNASLLGSGDITITNGQDGASAYELWLAAGNTGTVADFLESLKGDTGVVIDEETFMGTIVNDLTTGGADKALSAQMGKDLNGSTIKISESGSEYNSYFNIDESINTYLDRDGTVRTSSTVNSYGVTDYIPVNDVSGFIAKTTLNTSAVAGCAVYDSSKTFLRCNTRAVDVYTEIYIKQDGDAYVRFTLYNSSDPQHYLREYPIEDVDATVISGYHADKIAVNATVSDMSVFSLKSNANLLNPVNVVMRNGLYFSSTGTLSYSSSASTSGVTGFVPFGEHSILKMLNQTALSGSLRNCVYDEGYNFVRATTSATLTKGEGEAYVRFTIKSSTTNLMVCDSGYSGEYVDYALIPSLNKDILELEVTVDDISQTDEKYLSDNICDPETCYFGNDKYINRANGTVASYTSSNIGGYTDYIPIDEQGVTFSSFYWSGTAIGGAVYNANKQYIRSAGSTGIVRYEEGDAYVRFTLPAGASSSNVMVNKGTSALDYVPYAGVTKVISKDILPDFAEGKVNTYIDGVEVVMPDEIVVTRGDNLQLFYRSMVKSVNPYAFDLLATCSAGTPYPRYMQLQTAYNNGGSVGYLNTGTRIVTMRVRDNQSRLIDTKSSTIRIIPLPTSPATNKNILVVGASTIAGGATTAELKRRLIDTTGVELTASNISNYTYFANPKGLGLNNIGFVGRQTSGAGVKQDGVSGRKMKDVATAGTNSFYTFYFTPGSDYSLIQGSIYSIGDLRFTVQGSDISSGDLECTLTSGSGSPASSGTLTLYSGEGSASVQYSSVTVENSNPFWNGIANKIDFQQYSSNYCDGDDIDIIVSHLGINDIFSPNESVDDLIGYTKDFIQAYHTDYPNGKFVITTLVLPDVTGGMGSSYQGSYANTYWNIASLYFEYSKKLFELASDAEFADYVILCSSMAEFDNENLFSHKSVPTSNRSTTTELIGTNALHYSTPGFTSVADSMFHSVCYALNQLNS